MKNFLLYLSIFILLVLLFLPWGLRTFAKDVYKTPEKPKDVIETLSCNKLNESMNITYLNGKTYNIAYNITGNYELETEENLTSSQEGLNPTKDLRILATIEYNPDSDITIFRVDLSSYTDTIETLNPYTRGIDEEINVLAQNGFSCTKSVIS